MAHDFMLHRYLQVIFSNRTCIRTSFDLLYDSLKLLFSAGTEFLLLLLSAVLLKDAQHLLHSSKSHISQKVVIHEITSPILHNSSTRHRCVILSLLVILMCCHKVVVYIRISRKLKQHVLNHFIFLYKKGFKNARIVKCLLKRFHIKFCIISVP